MTGRLERRVRPQLGRIILHVRWFSAFRSGRVEGEKAASYDGGDCVAPTGEPGGMRARCKPSRKECFRKYMKGVMYEGFV